MMKTVYNNELRDPLDPRIMSRTNAVYGPDELDIMAKQRNYLL